MTTWLSQLSPAEHRPDVNADLADAVRLHHRIMRLFPDGLGEQARANAAVLFRVDTDPRGTTILVQSTIEPDPTSLPDGYAHTVVRTLDPLLHALRPGLPLRYRLTANATRKLGHHTTAGKPLTVIPLHGPQAEEWWGRKAQEAGLELRIMTVLPLDAVQGTNTGKRHGSQFVRHARTRFDGSATIMDPDLLRHAVTIGIGRGKSYGCGLLSIAPA
jgi:CRISPR system Cascade subunit CasE